MQNLKERISRIIKERIKNSGEKELQNLFDAILNEVDDFLKKRAVLMDALENFFIFKTDRQGKIIFTNDTSLSFFQKNETFQQTNSLFLFLNNEETSIVAEILKNLKKKDILKLKLISGNTIKYFNFTVYPLTDYKGKSDEILWSGEDVTEQMAIIKKLQLSEQRFRDIADASSQFLFETNPEGVITYISPRVSDLLGINPEYFIGHRFENMLIPSDVRFFREKFYRIISSQRPFQNFACRFSDRFGNTVWISLSGIPVYTANAEFLGYRGSGLNITPLKENEIRLLEARQLAENASRLKSEFFAMMSHELRTPLNVIIGSTDLLSNTQLDSEQKELLHTIHSSSESLLHLVNDILDFSKIEALKLHLEPEKSSITDILDDIIAAFSAKAKAKNLQLLYILDSVFDHDLYLDTNRLKQILVNLTGNAIKFTEKGSVVIRASRYICGKKQPMLKFKVIDTGIGIRKEKLKTIFEVFEQGDDGIHNKYGGTGLGLAISKNLVKLMGGNISCKSKPGSGTDFTFAVNYQIRKKEISDTEKIEGSFLVLINDPLVRASLVSFCQNLGMSEKKSDGTLSDLKLILCDSAKENIRTANALFSKNPEITLLYVGNKLDFKVTENILPLPTTFSLFKATLKKTFNSGSFTEKNTPATLPDFSGNPKILIAEDNPMNQKIIGKIIQRLGLEYDIASDGKEAVEKAKEFNYPLILMDLNMPELSGFEAAKKINAFFAHKSNKPFIVALSANAGFDEQNKSIEYGMVDYLPKPVKIEDVAKVLRKYLKYR